MAAAKSPSTWSRWDLHNNRVYLQDINFSMTADPDSPIATAVKNANNDTIVMAFNVAAYHDGAPVIDVSRLYQHRRSGIQRAPAHRRHGVRRVALVHGSYFDLPR